MRRHALVLAILAGSLLPSAARADALSDAVSALDPTIQEVRVVSEAKADGAPKRYRIVLARTASVPPTTRLFVQSLTAGTDGAPSVAWTSEINELAELKLDVSALNAQVELGGLTVFVEVAHLEPNAPALYELLVEDDGTYRFDPASN